MWQESNNQNIRVKEIQKQSSVGICRGGMKTKQMLSYKLRKTTWSEMTTADKINNNSCCDQKQKKTINFALVPLLYIGPKNPLKNNYHPTTAFSGTESRINFLGHNFGGIRDFYWPAATETWHLGQQANVCPFSGTMIWWREHLPWSNTSFSQHWVEKRDRPPCQSLIGAAPL